MGSVGSMGSMTLTPDVTVQWTELLIPAREFLGSSHSQEPCALTEAPMILFTPHFFFLVFLQLSLIPLPSSLSHVFLSLLYEFYLVFLHFHISYIITCSIVAQKTCR
jgi:hypothetical protein